jgi:hypothetical protein
MRQQNSALQLRVASGPRNGRERLRGHAQLSSVVRRPIETPSRSCEFRDWHAVFGSGMLVVSG